MRQASIDVIKPYLTDNFTPKAKFLFSVNGPILMLLITVSTTIVCAFRLENPNDIKNNNNMMGSLFITKKKKKKKTGLLHPVIFIQKFRLLIFSYVRTCLKYLHPFQLL